MQQPIIRAIARNLVIAATIGLAVVASWAVTGVRTTSIEMGNMNACVPAGATGAAQCKLVVQQG